MLDSVSKCQTSSSTATHRKLDVSLDSEKQKFSLMRKKGEKKHRKRKSMCAVCYQFIIDLVDQSKASARRPILTSKATSCSSIFSKKKN